MKLTSLLMALLFWGTLALAETRIVGVHVQRAANGAAVSIVSDVAAENCSSVSVKQAQTVLRAAEGWGSSVLVGVVAHDVPLSQYLPLLEAIAANAWLDLVFVDGMKRDFLYDNIRKRIESARRLQGLRPSDGSPAGSDRSTP